MKREEIEEKWVDMSIGYRSGKPLCSFTVDHIDTRLGNMWRRIWEEQDETYIHHYYFTFSLRDQNNMAYLCRALSLNMLLDDNEEILD